MFIFKLFGVTLIVTTSTLIGFLKSRSLIERRKKLSLLLDGTNALYNYIDQGEFELEIAVNQAFGKCGFLSAYNGQIVCDDIDLKKDKLLIDEFFMRLGYSTKKIECDSINHFTLKLNSRLKEASNDATQKCRVYQTLGVCAGLTIGILLI